MNDIVKRITSLDTRTRTSEKFYVEFLKYPENLSNFLGRQVKSFQRPEVGFDVISTPRRSSDFVDQGKLTMQPVQFELWDDENSITSTLLHLQILRQSNLWNDVNNTSVESRSNELERDYRFEIRVNFLNAMDEVVETVTLTHCFISAMGYSPYDVTDKEGNGIINIQVTYENFSTSILDDYTEFQQRIKDALSSSEE